MKYRIISCICLICILLFGLMTKPNPVSATGTIYYVAKTGSDNNLGTLAQPWLTINHAAFKAKAGDTIEVETGTYNEYVFDCYNSGTAANPITFENYPGESPVIDGTGLATPASNYGLIYIAGNISYINWSGFTVQNSQTYEGIYIFNSSYINITNMVIHNTYASAIKMQGTGGYITINNCQIYNCNTSNVNETIDIMPMNNVTIENCYLHNNPYDGIDVKDGSNNISIHNNEITSMGNGEDGIYIDCQGQIQDSISIYDNNIHGFTGDGIVLGSEPGGSGTLTNCSIYNNLIYNINGEAIQAQPYSFNKTVSIINNTFYNDLVGIDFDDPAQYQINCVVRNNIIVGNTTSALINYPYYAQGGVTVDHNLFYSTAGYNTVYGTNYVKANPLLTNPPTDFSLQSGSPTIGAGSSVGAPSTDYIGTARPQSQGYDIGAYEYVPASTPPSTITINAIVVGSPALLPTASASYRGIIAMVQGGSGVTDTLYQCMKSAADTYSWVRVATGG